MHESEQLLLCDIHVVCIAVYCIPHLLSSCLKLARACLCNSLTLPRHVAAQHKCCISKNSQ
jgi:hypothetical protein